MNNLEIRINNILIYFLSSVLLIISSCDLIKSRKWNNLKNNGEVYKKDTIEKFFHSILDDSETVWLNKSYINFPYKENCGNRIKVTCELSDTAILWLLKEDSLSIANQLIGDFKQRGIAIFGGQTIDKVNLNILIYTEDEISAFETLNKLQIPYKGEISDDKEWKYYSNLMNKNKQWIRK